MQVVATAFETISWGMSGCKTKGFHAPVDAYVSIGTSLDFLYIPGECSENAKHPRKRFGTIARLFTNGKEARRVYRILVRSCKL